MMLVLLLGSCKALKLTPPPVSYSSSKNFADTFNAIVLPTYGRYPVGTLISGEGSYITTDKPDGNSKTTKYLDFVSGIATNSLGHNNPAVVGAVSKQLKEFGHVSNLYYTENQARLGQFLLSNTFKNKKGKVFFCNSGAETNEGVIKLMRKWGRDRKKLTHPYIITMSNSFHGRTTGALAATNSNAGKYQDGFTFAGEVNRGFKTVEYNNVQDLRAMVKKLNKSRSLWDVLRGRRKGLAGIMMETLQGEGGVLPSTKEFIKEARKLTKETNSLLAFDEVQTGMGRTGTLWNFQHYEGVAPDVLTSAKALGGGLLPLGAMIMTDECASVFTPGTHASTFGGNGLAVAAGLAVAKALTSEKEGENVLANVKARGKELQKGLDKLREAYPNIIGEVRGAGLILGVLTKGGVSAMDIVNGAMENGLLLVPAGANVVRFVPPLNVSKDEIKACLKIMELVLKEFPSKI